MAGDPKLAQKIKALDAQIKNLRRRIAGGETNLNLSLTQMLNQRKELAPKVLGDRLVSNRVGNRSKIKKDALTRIAKKTK